MIEMLSLARRADGAARGIIDLPMARAKLR
jgi:hypothetical protein